MPNAFQKYGSETIWILLLLHLSRPNSPFSFILLSHVTIRFPFSILSQLKSNFHYGSPSPARPWCFQEQLPRLKWQSFQHNPRLLVIVSGLTSFMSFLVHHNFHNFWTLFSTPNTEFRIFFHPPFMFCVCPVTVRIRTNNLSTTIPFFFMTSPSLPRLHWPNILLTGSNLTSLLLLSYIST